MEFKSRLGDPTFKSGDPEYDFFEIHLKEMLAKQGKTIKDLIPDKERVLAAIEKYKKTKKGDKTPHPGMETRARG